MERRESWFERRRRPRIQRRRAVDAAPPEPPRPWSRARRVLVLVLALTALVLGGLAAGYGIAAMRAVGSPGEVLGP
jgi:hypothetical protein